MRLVATGLRPLSFDRPAARLSRWLARSALLASWPPLLFCSAAGALVIVEIRLSQILDDAEFLRCAPPLGRELRYPAHDPSARGSLRKPVILSVGDHRPPAYRHQDEAVATVDLAPSSAGGVPHRPARSSSRLPSTGGIPPGILHSPHLVEPQDDPMLIQVARSPATCRSRTSPPTQRITSSPTG